jgi:hypothetical protein
MGDETNISIKKKETSTSVNDSYNRKIQECRSFIEEGDYTGAMSAWKSANMINKEGEEISVLREEIAKLKPVK